MKYIKKFHVLILLMITSQIWAMDPVFSSKQKIDIQTSDGKIIRIDRWQLNEIKVLLVLLEHHKPSLGQNNPLVVPINSSELNLLIESLNAIAYDKFERFYNHLIQQDVHLLTEKQKDNIILPLNQKILSLKQSALRNFINLTERMQAHIVNTFCLAYTLPSDVVKEKFTKPLIDSIKQLIPPTIQFLQGHSKGVTMALFSPDGSKVVSTSFAENNNLILWDITKKKPVILHYLKGHPSNVTDIAWSVDGKSIVSGCNDINNNVILWNIDTGKGKPLQGCPEGLQTVAFSPDGKYIVAGCSKENDNIIIWDMVKKTKRTLQANPLGVKKILFSPYTSTIMVSAGYYDEDNLLLWNIETGAKKPLLGHQNSIDALAFNKDGSKLVSCCHDLQNNLILWDIATGIGTPLSGQPGTIKTVAFNKIGDEKIMSAGITDIGNPMQGNICIWDLVRGHKQILEGATQSIFIADFHPDASTIITADQDINDQDRLQYVTLWDVKTGISHKLFSSKHKIRDLSFSPDARKIIVACFGHENNLILISLLSEQEEEALRQCSFSQAYFLYRLFLALGHDIDINIKSPVAKNILDSLPQIIQKIISGHLSATFSSKKHKFDWINPFSKRK